MSAVFQTGYPKQCNKRTMQISGNSTSSCKLQLGNNIFVLIRYIVFDMRSWPVCKTLIKLPRMVYSAMFKCYLNVRTQTNTRMSENYYQVYKIPNNRMVMNAICNYRQLEWLWTVHADNIQHMSAAALFCADGLTLITTCKVITCIIKCRKNLLIHCQSSTVQPLKFGHGWIISLYTL